MLKCVLVKSEERLQKIFSQPIDAWSDLKANRYRMNQYKGKEKALTDTSKFAFGLTIRPLSQGLPQRQTKNKLAGVCECFLFEVFGQRYAFQINYRKL